MRTLYHSPLCPYSRSVRLSLMEKKLPFALLVEKPWEERDAFIDLNPALTLPVLVDEDRTVIVEWFPIMEYLEEAYRDGSPLLPYKSSERAETRRMLNWIHQKFYTDVTLPIIYEKVLRRLKNEGHTNVALLRKATVALAHHFQYFVWLIESRNWMGGETFSLADISLAAHISVLDFLGYIPWEKWDLLKHWYACIKSRPSFRPLLEDHITGIVPPAHYANLDF